MYKRPKKMLNERKISKLPENFSEDISKRNPQKKENKKQKIFE